MTTVTDITIGGSEIAAVCGLDPYCSPALLAARKLGLVEAKPESQAMRIGKALEPAIAQLAGEAGYEVIPAPRLTLIDSERPWCVGRPDGYTVVSEQRAVAELKAVSERAHRAGWEDGVPDRYQVQVQWYLHLTNLSYALLAAFVGGQRLELYTLERNDRAITYLLDRAQRFVDLVKRGQMPEFTGSASEYRDMAMIFRGSPDRIEVEANSEVVRAVERAQRAQRRYEQAREAWEKAAAKVQATMGDATVLVHKGRELARWVRYERSSIDTKSLRAEHPEIAKAYTRLTSARRFTLVERDA